MAKITDVFKYLKDYNNIRNPVITLIEKQEWSYNLLGLPSIDELWSIYGTQDFNELKILEIERPTLLPCPPPAKEIRDWIDTGWDRLSVKEIRYIENKKNISTNQDGDTVEETEYFTDNDERVEKYDNWIKLRVNWYENEKPKEVGLRLYNQLFSLYSRLKREAESLELILGDGLIRWSIEGRVIDHPLILQKVNLRFNSNKPSFIIDCDEIKTEIYSPMLRVISSINQTILSEIIKEIEESNNHIADINNNIGSFKRLINAINEKGKYSEESNTISSNPIISHEPVIFLRKRNLGFTEFINRIIIDIESKEEDLVLPRFFNNLLGNHNNDNEPQTESIKENWNQSGIDEEILLTLPANNEQMKIVKYLDSYGAVLVQGPPGTGKTHTIANLIGHLLSRGDSVLVTSHTEKALTVLKDKVYKELQSLCISLLSSSSERKEMDATLFAIAEKGTTLDENESMDKIRRLENERKDLINIYKDKNKELLRIRTLQYKDIIYGNTTIKPIDAAKFIREGKDKLDFIPGKTIDDTIILPITIEELEYLYKSNELIHKEDENILSNDLPDIEEIWTREKLQENISSIKEYRKQLEGWEEEFIFIDQISKENIMELYELSNRTVDTILDMDEYERAVINKSITDNLYGKFWEEIFNDYNNLKLNYEEYRKISFYNNYDIPSEFLSEETLTVLDEIIGTGKTIPINFMVGITKPKWKKLKDSITRDRKSLEKLEEFKDVKSIVSYIIKKEEIINRINKLNFELEVKEKMKLDEFEDNIDSMLNTVEFSLAWFKKDWVVFLDELRKYILNLKIDTVDCKSVESILHLCKVYLSDNIKNHYISLLVKDLEDKREGFILFLNQNKGLGKLFENILEAVKENSIEEYDILYKKICEIYSKKEAYKKRMKILEELGSYAKDWSGAIRNRGGIHGLATVPKDIQMAWKWRQLNNQLDRINSYDPNKIQREIENITNSLMKNAKNLAYEKAWYKKIKNNTDEQTQAIEGWRQTIRQIGKGTGKHAPMLREKARKLMPKCQTAIPVWIMPLNRVAENFSPETNKFDVIIIDEASQADVLALSALYLGKKIIIVGDDEQVSPESVGIKVDEVSALAEQYLQGIPNNHLFGGRTSIYDMAKTSGFKPIMLVEHFRCLPEIIEFSNKLSYNEKIKPLRGGSNTGIEPAVIEYRVPDGVRSERKVNYEEVEHITSLICACIEEEAYANKTIGVISLLGHEQAYEIDKSLQIRLDPKEYENRKIQCGNPAQFQGDERDIIFLSIVDSPKEGGGPLRLLSQDGNNDINRKRYNVAASRAKDQMWVVHSLNPEIDLQPDDIRLRLIKHAINPGIEKNNAELKKTESDFEEKVMKYLLNKGYKVYSQWKVGAYRIDLVVEDGNKMIAVECDGERWHSQDDLPNDLKRQAILERLGWKFIRIRGSEFYKNPELTMEWVYNELEDNGIKPNFFNGEEGGDVDHNNRSELLDGIKRKAESIRRGWNNIENEEDEAVDYEEEEKLQNQHIKNNDEKDYNVSRVDKEKENYKDMVTSDKIEKSNSDDLGKSNQKSKNKSDKGNNEVKSIQDHQQDKSSQLNIFENEKVEEDNKKIGKPLFDFRNRN